MDSMPLQGSLFDETPSFDRSGFATTVRNLAARRIFIGTSSWRYEGWLNRSIRRSVI